ncbi:MAG: hypothetical protein J5771_05575 [Bacteroidales bacterium]|nr:hypothetical protein [Bacteroidales bacterium]
MKKILLAIAALAILAVSCGKDEIATKKEIEKHDPTSISFSKSSLSLIEGQSETVSIKWSPSYAKEPVLSVTDAKTQTALVISSNDESVARAVGTKIVAVSPGNAVITAKLANDPSVNATCSVEVGEDIHASAVESIIVSSSSCTLCDLNSEGTGDDYGINVLFSPSERTWDDVTVFADDNRLTITKGERKSDGRYELRVKIAANTGHYPTDERTAKVTIKAKKGDVSKVLSVDIRGHIYGISIPKLESKTDNMVYMGKVRLVKGKTFDLETEILKTGANAKGTVTYTSNKSDVLSVTSSGVLSVSGTPEGGSVQRKVTVSCSAAYGVSPIEVPVYTYAVPTSYTITRRVGDNTETYSSGSTVQLFAKTTYRLNITASPSTALCDLIIKGSVPSYDGIDYLTEVSVNNDKNTATVDFTTSSYGTKTTSNTLALTSWVDNVTLSWKFYTDVYTADDVKLGDYVYYNKSTDPNYFYRSDGGLRAVGPNYSWVRQDGVAPKSTSTLIGFIYDVEQSYSIKDLKLRGFRNYGTTDWAYSNHVFVHAAVISAKSPEAGTYTWQWADSDFDLAADSRWDKATWGEAPKENAGTNAYCVYEGLRRWNAAKNENRVKAIYAVDNYNDYDGMTANAGKTGACPLKIATSSAYGSTGWVLPLKKDMEKLIERLTIVNNSISRARSASTSCADLLVNSSNQQDGRYWLASYSTQTEVVDNWTKQWRFAYYWDNGSILTTYKTTTYRTRPIVFI